MPPERQRARLRFQGGLRDFLPASARAQVQEHAFWLPPAVKDAIEACGVPHTEVQRILINGEPAGFTTRLQGGDDVVVYPRFEEEQAGVLPALPQPLRFVLDANLGRLAVLLRLVGFDALYRNDFEDAALAALAAAEQRMLLTRDRGLLKRRLLVHGSFVRATAPETQLLEVLRRFRLQARLRPFSRCLRCNGALEAIGKAEVAALLPPRVRASAAQVSRCQGCGRVYWPGTHFQRMQDRVRALQQALAREAAN